MTTTLKCSNCFFYQGADMCLSIECMNSKTHPRFLSRENVDPLPKKEDKRNYAVYGKQAAWIDLDQAMLIRSMHVVTYPNMKELTDDCKKQLRKRRNTKHDKR